MPGLCLSCSCLQICYFAFASSSCSFCSSFVLHAFFSLSLPLSSTLALSLFLYLSCASALLCKSITLQYIFAYTSYSPRSLLPLTQLIFVVCALGFWWILLSEAASHSFIQSLAQTVSQWVSRAFVAYKFISITWLRFKSFSSCLA